MSEVVRMYKDYPVATEELSRLNTTGGTAYRVRWTGEFRPPKFGEWYLSGAIIEGYKAYANTSTPFCIARLIKGKNITTFVPDIVNDEASSQK